MIFFSNEEVKKMQQQTGKSENDFWFSRKDIEKCYENYGIKVSKEYIDDILTDATRLAKFGDLLQKEGVA